MFFSSQSEAVIYATLQIHCEICNRRGSRQNRRFIYGGIVRAESSAVAANLFCFRLLTEELILLRVSNRNFHSIVLFEAMRMHLLTHFYTLNLRVLSFQLIISLHCTVTNELKFKVFTWNYNCITNIFYLRKLNHNLDVQSRIYLLV